MHEPFIISVNHLGTEYDLRARFERWGYTHRIAVLIGEHTVIFEPDEEGGYRAIADKPLIGPSLNIGLLQSVSERLAKLGNR